MKEEKFIGRLFLTLCFIVVVVIGVSIGGLYKNRAKTERTLGYESYLAQGTCEEPTGGCMESYYWNSDSCSCQPLGGCEEPAGDCGEHYYWDSASCACIYDGECEPPTEGCGMNHYWDYNLCSCEHEASCTEPTGGCETNHYWDSASCSCLYDGSCSPPSGGCGDYYYYDYTACQCVYSCYEPAGGCGVDYYWNSSSCSCVYTGSSSGCEEPVEGCDTNHYWDYSSCSCKTDTHCTPPSTGCGDNYYWDDYSCNCKQYPDYYGCYEPTGGCGDGWYWDESTCICKSDYGDQTYDPTSNYSPYVYEQDMDRLAYESPEKINCVKSILTPTEYERLRYLVPTNNNEHEEIYRLGDKVKTCWGYAEGTGQTSETLPIEGEKCLIDALGKTAYEEIYQGERHPTHEEHLKFEKCFGHVEADTVNYVTDEQSLPKVIDDCLRSVLRDDLYNKVKSGRAEVPYDLRNRVNRCFGVDPQPFEEGHSYKIPDDVKNCLLQAVGEGRFNEINSGASEPTEEEKQKGEVCFGKLNKDQAKFLPPPSEQVPYLDPNPDLIKLAGYVQDKEKIKGEEYGGKIVFKGKGPPNSLLTLYLFSEPIVVTTQTDENGDWIYELNQPLEGGKHVAYATIRTEEGKMVRSSVFNFDVIAAAEIDKVLLREEDAENVTSKFIKYAFLLLGISVLLVFGITGHINLKKMNLAKADHLKEKLTGGEGKSKSDTGSGSVN